MPDLLNTSNVPLAPSAKTSETVLPDWYTNYAMQVLSNQQAVAATPYTPYASPRIADFTPDQQAGFEATRAAAGSFAPLTGQAGEVLGALQPNASATAAPWLQRAGATSASQVGQYMDPYQDLVVDRIGELGARNLRERILPSIQDTFIGAGHDGTSSRAAESIGRAIRDTQEGISAEQNRALSTGYQGALQASGADLSRFGALGESAGRFATADTDSGIRIGGALTDLASRTQEMGLRGAGALTQVGNQQQALGQANLDAGYQDFLRQQGWDQTRIDNLVKTLQAVSPAVPKSILEQGYGPVSDNGSQSPSTAAAIASAVGALLLKP